MTRYGQLTPRRYWLYWVGFYIGIPSLFALQLGASEAGSAAFVAKHYYFLYFFTATIPSWWAKGLLTWLAFLVMRPWSPPLLVVLIIGSVVATHLSGIWAPLRHALFEPYLADGSSFYPVFPWRFEDPDYLMEAAVAWVTGGVAWVGANYIFLKVLKFPRYGCGLGPGAGVADAPETHMQPATGSLQAQPATERAGAAPVRHILWDQLPENLGRNIVALKAEEHYTRVFTEKGEALVLMRFRDAVALLEDLGGVQTHRSYWVNPAYVGEVVREGRSSHLHLSTGQQIPISRSYRVMALQKLGDRALA